VGRRVDQAFPQIAIKEAIRKLRMAFLIPIGFLISGFGNRIDTIYNGR
jgi:hypothetical protein